MVCKGENGIESEKDDEEREQERESERATHWPNYNDRYPQLEDLYDRGGKL